MAASRRCLYLAQSRSSSGFAHSQQQPDVSHAGARRGSPPLCIRFGIHVLEDEVQGFEGRTVGKMKFLATNVVQNSQIIGLWCPECKILHPTPKTPSPKPHVPNSKLQTPNKKTDLLMLHPGVAFDSATLMGTWSSRAIACLVCLSNDVALACPSCANLT